LALFTVDWFASPVVALAVTIATLMAVVDAKVAVWSALTLTDR